MHELKIGIVYQIFADGSISGPFLLKELPWEGYNPIDYWYRRVNLYSIDHKWSHVASINSLINNMPISSQA